VMSQASLFALLMVALAASLTGCGAGGDGGAASLTDVCGDGPSPPSCKDGFSTPGSGEKTTYTFQHEGVINMLEVGDSSGFDDSCREVDVRVASDSSNTTEVSIELFANLKDDLTVSVAPGRGPMGPRDGIKLKIGFGYESVCNTGLKLTITVPAPLQHIRFLSKGRATVDQIDCTNGENQPVYSDLYGPLIQASNGGSVSVGEVVCDLPYAVKLEANNDADLEVAQLNVRQAHFRNRPVGSGLPSSLLVSAGEVTESAYVESSDGGVVDLRSVTSPDTEINMQADNFAITGLVSEKLGMTVFGSKDPEEWGTVYTTVTSELKADCIFGGAWNETAVTFLGTFTRTGSCFDDADTVLV